jgi:hypothetical protein
MGITMAQEIKQIDISDSPELLRLVEEMRLSKMPVALRRGDEEVGVLMPPRRSRVRQPRLRPFTQDDPIWNLNGIGRSGVRDVSENVDTYLAEAYLETHNDTR